MIRTSQMSDEQFLEFLFTHSVSGGDDGDPLGVQDVIDNATGADVPPPAISTAPAQMDPSILGGQPGQATYTGPTGGNTGIAPTLSGMSGPTDATAMQQDQAQGNGSAGNPIVLPPQSGGNMTGAATPTNPGTRQSAWMNVVKGALFGMMAGAGTKNIGTGMAAGLDKNVELQQQGVENQRAEKQQAMQQQQLQFESVRAADSHINALDQHSQAMQLSRNSDLEYSQKSAEYQNFLQDNFGVEPDLSFNDRNTDANAGIQTLAQNNGGTIPPVATVLQPSGKGWGTGNVAVYSPTQTQMKQNANGFRDLINTQRRVQGLPDMDDATFNSLGFKGQRDAAQSAIEALKPTPAFNMDKNSPNYLPVVLAQKQQQLSQYQTHKDVNGKTDADPNVEKQLQNGINYLQSAWDSGNKMENDAQVANIKATAPAKADAAKMDERARQIASQPFKQAQARFEQTLKDGDPASAGALLAQGLIAPSQVISTRQPSFAQQALKSANDYSKQTTGKPYNAQVAEGYFKTAQTPQNVTFFGSAKSLTDSGGTLDQLQANYKKLPDVAWRQFPKLNSYQDWVSASLGGGSTAGFAQTAIGVADDYAKVMGGGQGSDTARDQVLKSFAQAHSPEQMEAAISSARMAVDSQMNSRIGTNPVMKGMYGDQLLVHVKDPQGGDHAFRTQQQADSFKKQAGIQ